MLAVILLNRKFLHIIVKHKKQHSKGYPKAINWYDLYYFRRRQIHSWKNKKTMKVVEISNFPIVNWWNVFRLRSLMHINSHWELEGRKKTLQIAHPRWTFEQQYLYSNFFGHLQQQYPQRQRLRWVQLLKQIGIFGQLWLPLLKYQ